MNALLAADRYPTFPIADLAAYVAGEIDAMARTTPERRDSIVHTTLSEIARVLSVKAILEPIPPSADAELIAACNRLCAINKLAVAILKGSQDACDVEPTKSEIDGLWDEESDLEQRIYKMAAPSTPEGALAVARAALPEAPRDQNDIVTAASFPEWLALTVVEHVAGERTPAQS